MVAVTPENNVATVERLMRLPTEPFWALRIVGIPAKLVKRQQQGHNSSYEPTLMNDGTKVVIRSRRSPNLIDKSYTYLRTAGVSMSSVVHLAQV